jgi:DNA-binding response OmpR family regulator
VLATVLLVEADRDAGALLASQLVADGYRAELARSAEHARLLARTGAPDVLVVGGLGPPRASLDLLEEVRAAATGSAWWSRVPAIVLGDGNHELALLRSFEAGADDFIAPPVRYIELRLRLRALLARGAAERPDQPRIAVGALAVDLRTRTATVGAHRVDLRRREFDLLAHLARDPRRVFSRAELLAAVWGYRAAASPRTLDSHASRLRRKLAAAAVAQPQAAAVRWVVGVRAVGYRLI